MKGGKKTEALVIDTPARAPRRQQTKLMNKQTEFSAITSNCHLPPNCNCCIIFLSKLCLSCLAHTLPDLKKCHTLLSAALQYSWSLGSNQTTRSSWIVWVRVITEEGSISLLQCFFPTLISLRFWISGSECIFRCCREVHSRVILTRLSPHDGLPEQQLLREGQPGPALDGAVGDKGDGPVVRAVWRICLVTQRAPCRDTRGQQPLKTYSSSYSAISSLPVCFSSATAKGCFYHVQLPTYQLLLRTWIILWQSGGHWHVSFYPIQIKCADLHLPSWW